MRWRSWLRYYSERRDLFGAERLFLVDDGSPLEDIALDLTIVDADCLPDILPDGPVMFRFQQHLGRHSLREFPGWWRSFTFASLLCEKYSFDKIIHIESDAFVVSRRMAEYIRNLTDGWTLFFCPAYGLPETAIQVICRDSIPNLRRLWDSGHDFWQQSMLAELTIPCTAVNKSFVGDRYGENYEAYRRIGLKQIDYVCQARATMIFHHQLRPPLLTPYGWLRRRFAATFVSACLRLARATIRPLFP